MTTKRLMVLSEVRAERLRQDEKWGVQSHPDGTAKTLGTMAAAQRAKFVTDAAAANGRVTWRDILNEEVAEAFAESDEDALRAELIQVAAVTVAWVEAIDRRRAEREAQAS